MTSEEIRDRFTYHPLSDVGKAAEEGLSECFITLAEFVDQVVSDGREKALAFTALEKAKMWASTGVARNPEAR
jgi:hypothetical protein